MRRMCKLLCVFGYSCEKTKQGADQGVNLIVMSAKTTLAIQCKFYSGPVGNQAVVSGKAV